MKEHRYINDHGRIIYECGKVVKRTKKGGETILFFRTEMKQEYPISWTRKPEELPEEWRKNFMSMNRVLEKAQNALDDIKNSLSD